jgi:putative MFS transporter
MLAPRLAVGTVTLVVLNIVIFGFLSFIPTFLVQQGFSIVRSIGFNTIMSLGGPVGGLIALLIADRIGRKRVLVVSALCSAVFGSFYPFVGSGAALTVVGFLLTTSMFVNSVTGFALFVPEMFPTEVRLRGSGFCNTLGRVVGALIPLAVVPLFRDFGVASVIALMVACLLAQASVVGLWGVEGNQRSLEELESDAPGASARMLFFEKKTQKTFTP